MGNSHTETKTKKVKWPGLVILMRKVLYGSTRTVKAPTIYSSPIKSTTPDEAIKPAEYRWFRRDELVRRCIIINAAYACFAAGFETKLEPVDKDLSEKQKEELLTKYAYIKTYVDQVNKQINLDNKLFIATVKRSLYGKAAFEVVYDSKKEPIWLLSLNSNKLKAKISEKTWALVGFTYEGRERIEYKPEEVLFFVNLQLEDDEESYEGLSDVEPILSVCEDRYTLLKVDFKKIIRRLWAPYALLSVDTEEMSEAEEDKFMEHAVDKVRAGESLLFNKSVTGQVVDLKINLEGLVRILDKLEEIIVRNFGTPRFLINKTPENRATAFVEFEAYIQGPIHNIQRYFKREIERQLYDRLVKVALKEKNHVGPAPVEVKHEWNTIRSSDFNELISGANLLYDKGVGLLGDYPELLFDMLGLDKQALNRNGETKKEHQLKNQAS